MLRENQLRKLGRAEKSGHLKVWWKDGQPHREDGPAIVTAAHGNEYWMQRGWYHRVGGPAMIFGNRRLWRIHGREIKSYHHYQQRTKCTDEELAFLKLKWGLMTVSSVAGLAVLI